jgi:uncharacterized protein YkwD
VRPPTSRTALASVLLAVLTTLLAPAPAEAQGALRYQRQAHAVTNDKRDNHDLVRLRKRRCVQRFARRQARRMARQERMFHQDLGRVMNRCNLSRVGENVAYGYPTGRRVVRAWMRSPGHRANILEPSYRTMGLAMRRDDDGTPYVAQVFGRH